MNEVIEKLGNIGLIPVIKLDSPEHALPLGKALLAGSLPVAEVTFRTDAAEESIKILSRELPELILGAGTVLTPEQADKAVAAGARYIVTPGFNPKVVEHCQRIGVPVTPGVTAPSQIEQALEMGLNVLKFFPAEPAGGVPMLKAFAGPYGDKVSFIPTGGVGPRNLVEYLSCRNVLAIGGSWMVPPELVSAGDFSAIEKLCRDARMLSLGFELLHVGIYPGGYGDAMDNARLLSAMFGMEFKEGGKSAFVSKQFEIMKEHVIGDHGHLAIGTLSVERAAEWLSGFGIKLLEDTITRKNGHITVAYIDRQFMGFGVHLSRK